MFNLDTLKTTSPDFDITYKPSELRNDLLYTTSLRIDALESIKKDAEKYNCSVKDILESNDETAQEYLARYINDHFENMEGLLW